MIRFLRGQYLYYESGSMIIETSAGIGFRVNVSDTSSLLTAREGDEVCVYTYMQVKEDGMALFGFGKSKKPTVPIYLAGANTGDNRTYYGSMQKEVAFSLRNWHMEKYFGESKMNLIGDVLCVAMLVIGLGYMVATLVSLMGGVM